MKNEVITKNIDSKAYSDEYIKELKYKDIVVDSLEEALNIAENYKESGEYDWFRGQAGLWPLISSTNRLNYEDRYEAEEKLKRFDNWAYANNLFKDFEQSEAIAQHYGLETMFIDFTTEPKIAAYFASDGVNYEGYGYSCIYCLNTEDFNDSLKDIKKFFPNLPEYPRLLDINVDNLWRLESQEGKFMYQPIINLDWFYSLHRIVFKVNENDTKPFEKSYIYPEEKSALEERLDSFFLMERNNESSRNTKNFIQELRKRGMAFFEFEASDELYIKEFIKNEEILNKHKWHGENLKRWANKTVEKYKDIYSTEKILFEIESFENMEQNKEMIFEQTFKLLNSNKDVRKKAIKFSIIDNEKNIELIQKFEKYSNIIWNGMRKLPYENDEIAKVMSDIIRIIDVSISEYENYDNDFIKIGFSDAMGSGNDALVNKNLLFESMRSDLQEFIVEKTKDVRTIIYHIRSPQLLYKFESLKKLFVESIIIYQVVYSGNDFVIFSPTELKLLGLP